MVSYVVCTKDIEIDVDAEDRRHAFALFFKDIVDRKIEPSMIGHVASLMDDGETYSIRTAPILFILGVIDRECAVRGISSILSISEYDAERVLDSCADQDKWIIDMMLDI